MGKFAVEKYFSSYRKFNIDKFTNYDANSFKNVNKKIAIELKNSKVFN